MGVLTYFWNGKFMKYESNTQIPVLETFTPKDVPDFDPDEWWIVNVNTTIGRKLLRSYPFCDPVINDKGELLDIIPWPTWKIYGEPEPKEILNKPKSKQRRRRKLFCEK